MMSLNENCTAFNFKNMKKSKENFQLLLYGYPGLDKIDKDIEYNKKMVDDGLDTTGYFEGQLQFLVGLRNNQDYIDGNLPRGIEGIILQTMEGYAFWQSIHKVQSDFFLVNDNYIHNLFNVNFAFMASCEVAKHFNNKKDDFSLCNVWSFCSDKIKGKSITTEDEVEYITEQITRPDGSKRDPEIKRFLDFRNKTVAHNSKNLDLTWSDFEKTIKFIARVWGIVDAYFSPDCLPRPIALDEHIYHPLAQYYSLAQINEMKKARLEIMADIFEAASTNLVTKARDNIKPFGKLNLSVSISRISKIEDR